MKRWASFLLLAACSLNGTVATMNTFQDLPIGASSAEVVSSMGQPYSIQKKEGDVVEYEYIERIKIGDRDAEERHYFVLLKNGQVISKRVQQTGPIPYYLNGFDSYQMQTTQNGEEES